MALNTKELYKELMRAYTKNTISPQIRRSVNMKHIVLFSMILSTIPICPILWSMEKTLKEPFVLFEPQEQKHSEQYSGQKNSVGAFVIARLSTNQYLIILGEFHLQQLVDYSENPEIVEGNKKVLQAIVNLIEQAEEFDTNKPAFHMLVEHVHALRKRRNQVVQETSESHIMTGLIPHALKRGYRRSNVENCENRAESYIAHMIMNLRGSQFKTYEKATYAHARIKECYNCDLLTLTWRDILRCHERLSTECQAYQDQWKDSPDIAEQFDELFRRVEKQWAKAKELIVLRELSTGTEETAYLIEPDEPIFTTMKHLNTKHKNVEKHLHFFKQLDELLVAAFCPFIEAKLLHRVLTLHQEAQVPVIVTYTGHNHALELYHALNDMESIVAEIVQDKWFENISPKEFSTITNLVPSLHRDLGKEKIDRILLVIAGSCIIPLIGGLILLATKLKHALKMRTATLAQSTKKPLQKNAYKRIHKNIL